MVFLSRQNPPLQYQFSDRQAATFLPPGLFMNSPG